MDKVPAPRPLWVMAAMLLLAAAAAVNLVRSMDAEYRGPRSRGNPSGSVRALPAAAAVSSGDREAGLVEVERPDAEGSLPGQVGDLLKKAKKSYDEYLNKKKSEEAGGR